VIGPFTISIDMIRIGITASLIVVPAHLLVILLFKNAGPKIPKKEESENENEQDLNASQVQWVEQSGKINSILEFLPGALHKLLLTTKESIVSNSIRIYCLQ